jgi:hypothetical protein
MDWRRGQESNLPRLLRTDNGFEDREGHQAPFTLRTEKENVEPASAADGLRRGERPTRLRRGRAPPWRASNVQHRTTEEVAGLFELFDRLDHGVEIGPIAGLEFGMEQFSIGLDFEGAATRRDKRERFDPVAEFKNFGRQTDGLRRVVSNHAVFDRDFGLHPSSFPEWKLPMPPKPVKAMRRRSVVTPARPGLH